MNTKFLVFTDLHVDIMHDGVARMEIITRAAREHHVDFILHLGDIMYPELDYIRQYGPDCLADRHEAWFLCDRDDEKTAIRALLAQTNKPVYGVLGNHDMDSCDKALACRYWNMPAPYYAFVQGGVRFIVLDTNTIKTDDGCIDYRCNNYKYYTGAQVSYMTDAQLQWLEHEIMASEEPCVLLSHASLADDLLSVNNKDEVLALIARCNRDKRRVILSLNGHSHIDGLTVRGGTPFININSASNIWIGKPYAAVRYSESIVKAYPFIDGCAPYFDPLYAVITLSDTAIDMDGVESCFVGKTPAECGFPPENAFFEPTACIRSRHIPLNVLPEEGRVTDKYLK